MNLDDLLTGSALADKAARIDDNLARLQFGSAFVIAGISGAAVIAIAPLFRAIPHGKEQGFYRRLLEHNAYMGGVASFAIQGDGWVVLHAARALKGTDAESFENLVTAVGKFADRFDDQLIAEFYMESPELTNQVDSSGIQLPQTD
ncbi:MAG TPA: CesT family type III secretion system chaperone [Kofleriaceae bacterium]|nr:CesT family type III secretion system chaperone [Kofleriaceae bacterium]